MEDLGGFRIWQTLRNSISLDQSFGFGLKKMKGEAHDCQPLQRRPHCRYVLRWLCENEGE